MVDLSDAVSAARDLLGYELIHHSETGITAGVIVETEAYTQKDPASHSYRGLRVTNAALFEEAGTIYVYFTYGMHYCANIVTGPKGKGEAVLLRALQPTQGLALMRQRRHQKDELALCSGPAKLVQAMGITKLHGGTVLGKGGLELRPALELKPDQIVQTTRVGISVAKDHPWRFYIKDSPYISKR